MENMKNNLKKSFLDIVDEKVSKGVDRLFDEETIEEPTEYPLLTEIQPVYLCDVY